MPFGKVPDSSANLVEGNTKPLPKKQISPAKRWCFTLNNYTELEYSSIVLIFKEKGHAYIIGDEIGENNGVPHLQGYVEFKTKCRPIGTVGIPTIHWEKAKGTPFENLQYCSKNKVLICHNMPKPIKVLENLFPWQKFIEEIYLGEINDRTIWWFWESHGNVGKSAFIKYMVVKYGVTFCCGGKYSDIMNLIYNQDMHSCNCIMFDIPRSHGNNISYASLESIKNGLVCNTKYETGCKVFNSPHVFVFANKPPDEEDNLSEDRWRIINIQELSYTTAYNELNL